MKSERFWILILTLTSFFAGVAGGVLFTLERNGSDSAGTFGLYHEQLVEEYDLSENDSRRLRQILAAYEEEVEGLKSRQLEPFQDELIRAGEDCRRRIAVHIIPEDRKDEFRLACGIDEPEPFSPTRQVH